MTQLLQNAIDAVKGLPADKQDLIATLMLSLAEGKRPVGLAKGLGQVPEDFNDELSTEELAHWYESHTGDPLTS